MGINGKGERKLYREEHGLEVLYVEIPADLKERASEEAYRSHLPMNEFIARMLAGKFGMPTPVIPRDYRRKPKEKSNGKPTNGHHRKAATK